MTRIELYNGKVCHNQNKQISMLHIDLTFSSRPEANNW